MKDKTIALILIIILAIVAIVIGATSYADQYGYYSQQGYGSMMGGMGGMRGNMMGSGMSGGMMDPGMIGGGYSKDSFSSNGERIYYAGIDSTGRRIGFEGGPMWLYMHGGSCVDCHGTNGKGGVPVMMGTAIPADLTNLFTTHSHGDEKMVMVSYTDDFLKRAITKGINANGESLDPTMPRWYMPEKDLNDLITYLKTLQTEDHQSLEENNATEGHTHSGNNYEENVHDSQTNAPNGEPSKTFLAAVSSVILGSFFLVQYLKSRM